MKQAIFLTTLIFIGYYSCAQDGTLDPSFGDNGKKAFQFYDDYSAIESIIYSNGKLFAIGQTDAPEGRMMTAVSFTSDGQLDMDFGENGLLHPVDSRSEAYKLTKLPDETYLGVGSVSRGNLTELLMARYDNTGKLITNFGDSGIVREAFIDESRLSNDKYVLRDVAYSENNKIIAAGLHYNGMDNDILIVSYNDDGSPNMNFGDGGYIIPDFEEEGWQRVTTMALHEGSIYVGINSLEDYYQIHKYDSLGNIDISFGQNGKLEIFSPTGGDLTVQRLIIEDKQYLVSVASDEDQIHVSKHNLVGMPHNSFGDNGTVSFGSNDINGWIEDVQVLSSGEIILGGSTPSTRQFLLTRLQSNGQIDRSFGNNGVTRTRFGFNFFNGIRSLDIDEEGSIYVGGITFDGEYNMAIAKYRNTLTSAPASFIKSEVTLFPNPVQNCLSLTFTSKHRSKVDIFLLNASGRKVSGLFSGNISQGENNFQFNISSSLPNGYYLLWIGSDRHGTHIEKISIIK